MKMSKKFALYSGIVALIAGALLLLIARFGVYPIMTQVNQHISMSVKYLPVRDVPLLNTNDDRFLMVFVVVLIIVNLLFLFLQMIYFQRWVMTPLREAVAFAGRLAKGDYKAELPKMKENDEMAELFRELGFIRDRMQNYLSRMESSREREQNARKRVETTSAVKGDFLANMSQELKNPLTVISGFTGLLRHELCEWEFTESKVKKCDIILENVASINMFFDKLMMLSQMGAGAYPLCHKEVDVGELLQGVIEQVYHRQEMRKITISCKYSPEQPQKIIADQDILSKALSLILEGIVKTSPAGSAVLMGCRKEANRIVFWINAPRAESGHSSVASIYRNHFQTSSSTRLSDISGVAMLNMAIAKSAFDLLQVTVSIDGPAPDGDHFSFSFNAEDVQEMPRSVTCPLLHYATNFNMSDLEDVSAADELGGEGIPQLRILILASDVSSSMLLAEIMQQQGHIADVAHTRRECRELLANASYHLLLIDLLQPYNRYLELIRHISTGSLARKIHVMVLASCLTDHEQEQFSMCGIDDCIFKPFNIEQLQNRIRRIAAIARTE